VAIVGLLLLFPPTRALARTLVKRRFRLQVYGGPPARRDGCGAGMRRGVSSQKAANV